MISIGVREGILALVAVLSLYLVVVLFRLSRHRRGGAPAEVASTPPTVAADRPRGAIPEAAPAAAAEDAAVSRELLNELELQQLRQDMAQLRTDCDFLRRELAVMRHDVDQLGEEARNEQQAAIERTQYARPVSPQHSEAMLLAGRGMSAAQVAEHCGISVAEAELVCALARAEGGT